MTQVSIVIPAYNATATLDRTLNSVRKQTHADLDIIVVNDGSTDDTQNIAERHADQDRRFRLIVQPNGGVATARNTGIEKAQNTWVAPIDADDIWHPRTVERFLNAAQAAPEPVTFVYTWSRRIDEADRVIFDLGRPKYSGDVMGQIIASNFTRNASASMLRRSAVLSVGGYDAGLQAAGAHGAEDIDLYLRLAALGPVAVAQGYHVGYRHVSGSMSQNADRMRRSIELALEKAEASGLDLNPGLFKLARTNYALYAGGLALSGGKWSELLDYIGKALALSPIYALSYLALVAPYSLLPKFYRGQSQNFTAIDPETNCSWPLASLLLVIQDRLHGSLLRSTRLDPS